MGPEILDQCPQVRTVVVPCGGGLLSGIAVAVKAARPDVQLVRVQAESAAAMPPSLQAGHPVTQAVATVADGIAVSRPGDLTMAHVARLVDEAVTVPDEAILAAVLVAAERARLVAEPAGAAGIAALLQEPAGLEPRWWWPCPGPTSTRPSWGRGCG
jgi:threonine dehydratase